MNHRHRQLCILKRVTTVSAFYFNELITFGKGKLINFVKHRNRSYRFFKRKAEWTLSLSITDGWQLTKLPVEFLLAYFKTNIIVNNEQAISPAIIAVIKICLSVQIHFFRISSGWSLVLGMPKRINKSQIKIELNENKTKHYQIKTIVKSMVYRSNGCKCKY